MKLTIIANPITYIGSEKLARAIIMRILEAIPVFSAQVGGPVTNVRSVSEGLEKA